MSLPLPAQTFYRLADQSPAANTLAALIDCFYNAFTATTDYRGTSLASTHQWTGGARYQNAGTTEAAYVAAPSGSSMTLAPKILVAGAASAGSATFQTDTFLASGLHAGIAKNTGAYSAWNSATPFTSGQWAGFNRITPTAANVTTTVVRPYVSEEMWVFDIWTAATSHYPFFIGAIIEGRTDDATTVESDDRLYGMISNGSSAVMNSAFLSGSGTFMDHSTSNGSVHGYVFQPGSASVYIAGRKFRLAAAPTSATGIDQDMSGAWMGDDIPFVRHQAAIGGGQDGRTLGRLREVYVAGAVQGARTLRNVSTDILHVIAYDNGNASAAILLPAVA